MRLLLVKIELIKINLKIYKLIKKYVSLKVLKFLLNTTLRHYRTFVTDIIYTLAKLKVFRT